VVTDRIRESDGGYLKWIQKKEEFCKLNNLEGIYLYDITALNQRVVLGVEELSDPEIIYYIRFDYIRNKN